MSIDLERLTQPFPTQAIQYRTGARGKQLAYIQTHAVIHRLNDATGNQWSFRLTSVEWRGDLVIAIGELEIPGLGTRSGIGVQRVSEGGGEDLVKGVASDALKKCATLFGVGLELYGPDYEAGEAGDQPVAENGLPWHPQSRQAQQAPPEQRGMPVEGGTPNQASPAQVRAIFARAKAQWGMSPDKTKEWVASHFGGKHIDDLTKQEASRILDRWQQEAERVDTAGVQ